MGRATRPSKDEVERREIWQYISVIVWRKIRKCHVLLSVGYWHFYSVRIVDIPMWEIIQSEVDWAALLSNRPIYSLECHRNIGSTSGGWYAVLPSKSALNSSS